MIRPAFYKGEKQLHTGFLAQDVEMIAQQLGYTFDGIHIPKNDKDYYSLAYSQFIMPLVKSVQEQQSIIETLQKQVEAVKAEIPMQVGKQQQIIEDQNKKIDSQAEQIRKMNEKIEALIKAVDVLTHK